MSMTAAPTSHSSMAAGLVLECGFVCQRCVLHGRQLHDLRPAVRWVGLKPLRWTACRRDSSAKAPDVDAASSLQNAAQDGKTGEVLEADEAQEPSRAQSTAIHSGPDPSARQVVEALSSQDQESFPRFEYPFADWIWIDAKAGNGGNPAPHALRSPTLKGPGYGGHGGAVYLKATKLIESFINAPQKIRAEDGGDGRDTHRGMHGKDYCLQVPLGTIVRERVLSGVKTPAGRGRRMAQFRYQFLMDGDTYLVAKGGIGGLGAKTFKKHDSRKPTFGQRVRLELELRVLNDCALIGVPNAGKTALLAAMSRAHTRISPEEYTTTRPHLGTLKFRDRLEIRVCDLPGLREGAHADKAMGRRILRHTYRSKALIFVVDVARGAEPGDDALAEVEQLREEACLFDPLNREKPWMVVGTKCDLLHKDSMFHLDSLFFRVRSRYGVEVPVVGTSARFGLGLHRMVRTVRQLLYPDNVEVPRRVRGVDPLSQRPGVLHGPFTDPLPALGTIKQPPLLLGRSSDTET